MVVVFLDDLHHGLSGLFAHLSRAVDDARDRGLGDIGELGNVVYIQIHRIHQINPNFRIETDYRNRLPRQYHRISKGCLT